jgi:hypothetical protein
MWWRGAGLILLVLVGVAILIFVAFLLSLPIEEEAGPGPETRALLREEKTVSRAIQESAARQGFGNNAVCAPNRPQTGWDCAAFSR